MPFVLQKNGFAGSLGMHNSEYDFYVQDNWHVTRKLVLNLGMRYDYNTVWHESHNHFQNFDIPTQTILPERSLCTPLRKAICSSHRRCV